MTMVVVMVMVISAHGDDVYNVAIFDRTKIFETSGTVKAHRKIEISLNVFFEQMPRLFIFRLTKLSL
jgi:hypothetical protein